jgi:hypothetical protein
MIDVKEFVRELKRYGVAWSESEQKHLIADEPLTNKDLKIMCSNKYGDEYNNLNNTQRTKVRMAIFKGIRYGVDD